MELFLRSIALAGGVYVPPETPILPPQRRRGRRLIGPAVGRGLQWLGAALNRAGAQLAATAQDCLGVGCETPRP
jgi:hypothetical protein